jgi:hypothetical protein
MPGHQRIRDFATTSPGNAGIQSGRSVEDGEMPSVPRAKIRFRELAEYMTPDKEKLDYA